MKYAPYDFQDRSRFLAIRAAAVEARKHDRAYAAAYAVAHHKAATPAPVAPRGLLARILGRAA
jgi:hypothetical protein